MSGTQIALMLIIGILLILAGYVGFRFVAYQLDKRFQVAPVQVTERAEPVVPLPAAPIPAPAWWEELEALRSQFGTLQLKVQGALAAAENDRKLARASEERTRKMLAGSGNVGELAALPAQEIPEGWEEAETAPASRPVALTLLEQRRAR